jgi:hypothetical protein
MFPAEIIAEIGIHLNESTWIDLICTNKSYYNNREIKAIRNITRGRLYACNKLLVEAVKYQNVQLIKETILSLAAVNKRVIFNKTLLVQAVLPDCPNIIRILLENFEHIIVTNVLKKLYIRACVRNKTEIVRMYLADENNNPDPFVQCGNSTFVIACKNKNTEIAKMIIQHPQCKLGYGNYYLGIACKHGLTDIVKILLQYEMVDPTFGGNLPLTWATQRYYSGIVELLLSDNRIGPCNFFNRAVEAAFATKNVTLINLFLKNKIVDLNLNNLYYFERILILAKDNPGIIKLLLKTKPNVSQCKVQGGQIIGWTYFRW